MCKLCVRRSSIAARKRNFESSPSKTPVVLVEIRNRRCLAKKFKLKTDKYIEKVVKTYGIFQEEKKSISGKIVAALKRD